MKVTAKQKMPYGRKLYAPGDVIEMSDKDAKLLLATGRVSMQAEAPAKAPQRAPEAAPHGDDEKHGGKGKKGTYKRRDQQAEHTEDASAEDDSGKGE